MNRSILINNKTDVFLAVVALSVILFPFLNLPRPATVTGHPWKIELLTSLFLLLICLVLFVRNSTENFFSNAGKTPFKLVIPIILFILWSGISYFWADSPRSVAHHTFVWINYLLVLILSLLYFFKQKNLQLVGYIFGGVSVFLFLMTSLDYLMVEEFANSHGRIRTRYGVFAELLLTIAPVLWAFALYSRKSIFKNALLIGGICAWMTVMFSLSKGAFLAGVFSFLFLFPALYFLSKKNFRRKVLVFAGIWLAVTVGTQVFYTYSSQIKSTVQHLSGEADNNRDTSFMRFYTWKLALQMTGENPLTGVGADNFGREFNKTRRNYAKINPNDPLNAHAEYYFVERSHNEFLQILAELGIVGFLLFSGIFLVLLFKIRQTVSLRRRKLSPLFWGSLAGMGGFFISSFFSSFSFRAMQNGVVFFMVLALLFYELVKHDKKDENELSGQPIFSVKSWKHPVLATLSIILFLSTANFLTHSLSNFYVHFAEKEKDLAKAQKLYDRALLFDGENASVYLSKGSRFYYDKNYREAAEMFQKFHKSGFGITLTYYYLAQSQSLSGNPEAAEKTLAEALEYFPHSTYARTHYAVLLEQNGKPSKAGEQFNLAAKLNKKEAKTWKIALEENLLIASIRAEKDSELIKPKDLQPNNLTVAILTDNRRNTSVSQKK